MTNGEKLDQIFPDGICPFSHNWLKSEYKQSNSDEDCISREQAIRIAEQGQLLGYEWQFKELCKLSSIQPKPKYVAVGNVNFDKAELQKIVDEAIPTIMPEIEYRKAHWQNNACSNCGIYNASAYKNWCPNCGCQMTEETE